VGAVICNSSGELISVGFNDVPRPGGGHYWPGDERDARDFVLGFDPSNRIKTEMLAEILHILHRNGWLSERHSQNEIDDLVHDALMEGKDAILKDAQIMNILEFGRVVDAEMSAIAEAARRGQPIRGATLYCTTFPCHICARHIIASGITKVVYIEPYPKSMAPRLYPEAIAVDDKYTVAEAVNFVPFLGISPQRYFDLFEMVGRRKDDTGAAVKWKRLVAAHNPTHSKRDRSSAKTNGKNGWNRPRKGWS
jgi:cytidine deaminase